MGFYFEMRQETPTEFKESKPLSVFWFLYAVGGFALLCMGLSAGSLLWQMAQSESIWDRLIFAAVLSFVPLFILCGLKLWLVRKFIQAYQGKLEWGFTFGKRPLWVRSLPLNQISKVDLTHEKRSSNLGQRQHGQTEYHIQGHWRVVIESGGKKYGIDRHTDREALLPLYHFLSTLISP